MWFEDWFGPTSGTDWFEDWFDPDGAGSPASGNGGISKSRILGTLAPRPQVPPWRHIEGPVGVMLTEIRRYLNEVNEREHTWGNHVVVTFTAPSTSVRVDTGLGGPPKGYQVTRSNADIRVFDGTLPAGVDPAPERGIIWLQASGAGTVTLYVY